MKLLNKLTFLALSCLSIMSCSTEPKSFEISGQLEGLEDVKTVLITTSLGDSLYDSTVENGKFSIKGQVQEPKMVRLYLGHNFYDIILENQKYESKFNIYNGFISGGTINDAVFGYTKLPEYMAAKKDAAETFNRVFTGIDMMDKNAVMKARKISQEKSNVHYAISNKYQAKIIEGDYLAEIKMYTLKYYYDWDAYTLEDRFALLDIYEKEIGQNQFLTSLRDEYKRMAEQLAKLAAVSVGNPYKDVIATSVDGKELKLSEVISKNKYTLLEMWASWCSPCRGEFPHLKKAYAKYHDKGLEIYALSLDQKRGKWLKALKEENVPWINVVDHKAWKGNAAKDYQVSGIPASFLIDSKGIIVASGSEIRSWALDEKLEELLGK